MSTSYPSPAADAQHPVIGLRVLPNGPCYLFEDFPPQYRSLTLGASERCHIRLVARYVSRLHCVLYPGQPVVVHNVSRNGTRVNGFRCQEAELHGGSVLKIGEMYLLAFACRTERMLISASTMPEFLRRAMELYGNERAAAEALGVKRSTLRGWLKKWGIRG